MAPKDGYCDVRGANGEKAAAVCIHNIVFFFFCRTSLLVHCWPSMYGIFVRCVIKFHRVTEDLETVKGIFEPHLSSRTCRSVVQCPWLQYFAHHPHVQSRISRESIDCNATENIKSTASVLVVHKATIPNIWKQILFQ